MRERGRDGGREGRREGGGVRGGSTARERDRSARERDRETERPKGRGERMEPERVGGLLRGNARAQTEQAPPRRRGRRAGSVLLSSGVSTANLPVAAAWARRRNLTACQCGAGELSGGGKRVVASRSPPPSFLCRTDVSCSRPLGLLPSLPHLACRYFGVSVCWYSSIPPFPPSQPFLPVSATILLAAIISETRIHHSRPVCSGMAAKPKPA